MKRLLSKTARPIGEIAAECSFANDNYLNNLFRRRFGMTMSEFRRNPH